MTKKLNKFNKNQIGNGPACPPKLILAVLVGYNKCLVLDPNLRVVIGAFLKNVCPLFK